MKYPPIQYHDYLGLNQLLGSQRLRSEEFGKPAHDEMLFIIVHQAYELWFKQMLFELDSVLVSLTKPKLEDRELGSAVARISRVVDIQKLINGQIDVLETMTPLDFLEFRDFLYPASGFQSFQWRLIETKLGLKADERLLYNQSPFYKHLKEDQQALMQKVLAAPSLFDCVEKWLERAPFLQTEGFDFWKAYQKSVMTMFNDDREVVKKNPRLSDVDKQKSTEAIDASEKTFLGLFDPKTYETYRKDSHFRLSYQALHAALFIQLYRDEPLLQMPFRLLSHLVDIDEQMTMWRYRHAQMVHRMLGKKIGTGGSSGHDYLKSATEKHKIFSDFFNLSTYLIPRSALPELPTELKKKLEFHY